MSIHADDIAALRRLLEGVEGFAGKMGWQWTERRRHIPPDLRGITSHDIALAVGVAMEMLPNGVRVYAYGGHWMVTHYGRGLDGDGPRLLPLLADVLCEPAGREGA